MKPLSALLCALVLIGCAHPKRAQVNLELPVSCIIGFDANGAKCKDLGGGLTECNKVVVKTACTRVPKQK